jgi:hypothetical protein
MTDVTTEPGKASTTARRKGFVRSLRSLLSVPHSTLVTLESQAPPVPILPSAFPIPHSAMPSSFRLRQLQCIAGRVCLLNVDELDPLFRVVP